jgi:hypothetical protein
LVFIETNSWNVIRILQLADKKIEKICFIPGTIYLFCWSSKQVDLKEPNTLFVLNARNGKIISQTKKFRKPFSCLLASHNGDKLFAKDSSSNNFYVFDDIRNLDDFKTVKTGVDSTDAPLAVSPDDSEIVVLGQGKAEFYNIEYLKQERSFDIGDGFNPDKALFVGAKNYLTAIKEEGAAYFFRGDHKEELTDLAGNIIFVYSDDRKWTLAVEKRKLGEIVLYSSPDLKQLSSFVPKKIKPRTKGDTIAGGYLPHSRGIVLLDSDGNLMYISKFGRKWRKKLIISALK